jgi:putative glycosyltransferase (TIGR04372 family)
MERSELVTGDIMFSRIKISIVSLYVALLGRPSVWLLRLLARSQLSPNALVRGIGYVPSQLADAALGFGALRFIAHVSRREPKRRLQRPRINNRTLRSYLYLAVGKADNALTAKLQPAIFRAALSDEALDHETQYALAHQLFQAGKLALACESFEDLIECSSDKFPLERRLQLLRDAGITFFMLGKIERANHYWRKAGELRRFILGEESGPIYRIVGGSWFAAIGHVAMLDFYAKYNKLYRDTEVRVVAQTDISGVPGSYLCERLSEAGIEFIEDGRLQPDYDRWAKRHGKRRWSQLTPAERFAMIDDFWEFEFPDGEVWGYTHAADKIQKEWERQQRPPILSVTDGERQFMDRALRLLGLPEGAWYVCLHVREPGFHKHWNALYPSMRDANIDDYLPAIDLIVKSGGWVIRMGDSSMKPLPPIPGVVDYAHSNLKTPRADILLALGCRFFLGTNSGFATIPAIYGVRCVFSNWLPIGLPLWPSCDLMMPKLFWDESKGEYLSVEEIFATGIAFMQNWSDLPKGITLRDNTPDEILDLTAEALGMSAESPAEGLEESRAAYQEIAVRHASYVGSTLAASFIRRHRDVFPVQAILGNQKASVER